MIFLKKYSKYTFIALILIIVGFLIFSVIDIGAYCPISDIAKWCKAPFSVYAIPFVITLGALFLSIYSIIDTKKNDREGLWLALLDTILSLSSIGILLFSISW